MKLVFLVLIIQRQRKFDGSLERIKRSEHQPNPTPGASGHSPHCASTLRRPASRYSVGEIDRRFRKIFASPSPLPAPQRRAILSTGSSESVSNVQVTARRACSR